MRPSGGGGIRGRGWRTATRREVFPSWDARWSRRYEPTVAPPPLAPLRRIPHSPAAAPENLASATLAAHREGEGPMRKVLFIFSVLTDGDVEWLAQSGERLQLEPG